MTRRTEAEGAGESCDERVESCNEKFGPVVGRHSGTEVDGGLHVDKPRALSARLDTD